MTPRPLRAIRSTGRGAASALVLVLSLAAVALAGVDAFDAGVGGFAGPRHTPPPSFRITAAPSRASVPAGRRKTFTLSIFQRGARGPVALRLISRPPRGVLATLDPPIARGRRARLRIATSTTTPARTYTFAVRAVRNLPPGPSGARVLGRRRMTVRVRLTVRRAPQASTLLVSGTVTRPLSPGASSPVDVHLANPYGFALAVTGMRVAIDRLDARRGDAQHGCTLQDFGVRAYSGPPVRLAKGQLRSLSQTTVPASAWPQLVMVNRSANQDGCKGASLAVRITATARQAR